MSEPSVKRVLVTGASRGIGQAIALRLAHEGYQLALHARSVSSLDDTIAALKSIPAQAEVPEPTVLGFSLSERSETTEAIAADIEAHGAYFGVVLNAGVHDDAPFQQMRADQWDRVLRTNLDGLFHVLRPIVPAMWNSKAKGRIVGVSSVSGVLGNPGQVNYSASKAGMIGALKSLSLELARKGITVNTVAPGLIKTDMTEQLPLERIMQLIPMRRLGRAEEVAGAVRFFLSEDASYITGQTLVISGGLG